MNVSLTPELDRYVLGKVETGRYSSASEVLRDALRLMQERDSIKDLQLAQAYKQIQSGLKDLSDGDFVERTASELYEAILAKSHRRAEAKSKMIDAQNL